MQKIWIKRCENTDQETEVNSVIDNGLQKGIIYDDFTDENEYNPRLRNPKVIYINGGPYSKRVLSVDNTAEPNIGMYSANSNKMIIGPQGPQTKENMGSIFLNKMKKHMRYGMQGIVTNRFNQFMDPNATPTVETNAFSYLRSNYFDRYYR